MKRILCALICVLMVLSIVACGNAKSEPLKFGLGVYVEQPSATDAAEKEGQGKVSITAAAVTLDADGKIVACTFDAIDCTVKYTTEGKAIANTAFSTKYELGNDYNMKAYGGSALEWFEQADALETVVAGKTLAEVKALVADAGKGTDEVINAGCTIAITPFINAIEKACANAADSTATADHALKLTMHTEQSTTDATEEKNGQNKVETTVFAAAVDADGKVVVASSDCVQVAFTFDIAGASTFDTTKAIVTKKEAGDNYNMKAYGGAALEWYEQAAAFDAACVGKTASEIAAMMGEDNYGTADLKNAGCTILVNGFVKAAAKIGK